MIVFCSYDGFCFDRIYFPLFITKTFQTICRYFTNCALTTSLYFTSHAYLQNNVFNDILLSVVIMFYILYYVIDYFDKYDNIYHSLWGSAGGWKTKPR